MDDLQERIAQHLEGHGIDGLTPWHHEYAKVSRASVEVVTIAMGLAAETTKDASLERVAMLVEAATDDPVAFEAAKRLSAALIGLGREIPPVLASFVSALLEGKTGPPKARPAREGLFWHRDKMIFEAVKMALDELGPKSKGRAVELVCRAIADLNKADPSVYRPASKRVVEEIVRRQLEIEANRKAQLEADQALIRAFEAREK